MDASVNRIPVSRDERAVLVRALFDHPLGADDRYSMDELESLVTTAGGIVAGRLFLQRREIDSALFIGPGGVDRVRDAVQEHEATLAVFDHDIMKPAQVRNLEERLKCRVISRTEVILDIFARRARSREAKIQVELAQLKYILPRLKGYGGVLSRTGGGIGTRGPGETMLETDRRHIQSRISRLKRELDSFTGHRSRLRSSRQGIVRCAVVGYTNAGKSSLINRLAGDDLFVENKLFATLDSFTRRVFLPGYGTILMTDTVGFIQKLPLDLVASFRSTLEEICENDFLLHVIDASNPWRDQHLSCVNDYIQDLGVADKPVLTFYNKCDVDGLDIPALAGPGECRGSVHTGEGLDELKQLLSSYAENIRPAETAFKEIMGYKEE